MSKPAPLAYGQYYHIYSRGNNRGDIFKDTRNYAYFLKLYAHHIEPIADTYAYCLMRNHFHVLIRVRDNPREVAPHTEQMFRGLFQRAFRGEV
ncbi:MAG: transposase [Chloroflexi bacterium]|nr:transposase [Chloroflexota bacterium]